MSNLTATLRIEATADGLVVTAGKAKTTIRGIGDEAESTGKRSASAMGEARSAFDETQKTAAKLIATIGGIAAVKRFTSAFIEAADLQGRMEAQIRRVSRSQEEYNTVLDRTREIADSAYVSINSVSDIYVRAIAPMRQLGRTTKETLDLTEAVSLALVVSSANADGQTRAIDALSKAMQGGKMQLDGFMSLVTTAPRFVEALEASLGKSRAELMEMVSAGDMTTATLATVSSQIDILRQEANDMPTELVDAMTRLGTAFQAWAGATNAQVGFTAKLVAAVEWLTENLDEVMSTAAMLAKVLATLYGTRLLTNAALYTAALVAQAKQKIINIALARELGIAQQQGFMASLKSIGLVNAALGVAGAALAGWQIGTYLREEFLEVERFGIAMVGGLLKAWERLKAFGVAAWEGIKAAALGAVNIIRSAAATLVGALASANEATDLLGVKSGITSKLREMEQRLRPTTSAWDGFKTALGNVLIQMSANEQSIDAAMMDLWEFAGAQREAAAATDAATESANAALATGALAKEQLDALAKARTDSARTLIELAGNTSELAAAEANYKITVMDAVAAANEQLAVGMQRAEVEAQLAASISAATAVLDEQTAAALANQQAHEQVLAELATERKLIGMTESARNKALAGMRAEDAMRKALQTAIKAGAKLSEEAVAARIAEARAAGEATEALAQYAQHLADLGLTDTEISIKIEGLDGGDIADPLWDAVEASDALRDALAGAFALTPAARLRKEIDALTAALNIQGITAEQSGVIQAQLETKRQSLLENNLGLISAGIGSLQSVAEEGSRSAQILEVAQNAVNLALAIGAVVNQGKGDPYTAFARMAAMAAAVVPLVGSIGGMFGGGGGSSENSSAYRQEHQGTGTVLGDSAAKSESILRAVEITADATEQLVGINRGMLSALQAMQSGIAGASTLLARSGAYGEFDALGNGQQGGLMTILGGLFSPIGGSFLTRAFANIFGGKESLRDEGIRIVGGTLSNMIDEIMVQSYQSIHRSGGWFSSSRDYDRFNDLGQDAAAQFRMVLGSMADAVRAAAEALGLNMADINAAIAAFRIEEIRISTMDLSAEEAQAELEAVFSSIFDGLAGHVVPFVAQFQKVGEGLAETLIRVATSVQVTQEAVIQLGFALDETDPERMAQISVGLMDLMGGIDEFIAGMSSFVGAFAPESHKFAVAQDALTRAFAQAGIEIPESRDAMWDLMQSLDATTESGRAQIAMLLQLAGVADSYYSMLEDRAATLAGIDADIASGAWQQYLDGLTDSQRAIEETTRYYDDWRDSLIAQGATAEQLTAVEEQRAVAMGRLLTAQAEQAAREQAELEAAGQRYADFITGIWRETMQLSDYQSALADADGWRTKAIAQANEHARAAGMAGASEQALALIELRASQMRAVALAQLREETQSLVDQLYGASGNDIGSAFTDGMDAASNAAADYWEQQRGAAVTLQEYLDGMLLGDLSALTPSEQLAEALSQFNAAVAGGDADAATRLGDTYLRLLRGHEASGEDYNSGFWMIRDALQGMLDNIGPIPDAVGDSGSGGNAYITAAGAEQIAAQNRLELAAQLAVHLADLSGAVGQTVFELMDTMGVDLRTLATDLGISLNTITGETVLALVNMAGLLGTNLTDLTSAMGMQLTDLGGGIRELAENTGVNLDALTTESVQALGGLANQLGIDLADIATSVGADLGSLADAQSLLNQALGAEILKLPADQASALENYFDSIVAATSEADANAAIDNMAGYINTLAPDIRNALAPYFEDVFPVDALTDLDYLTQIATDGAEQLAAAHAANALLSRIADNAMSANNAAGIPSYAVGTYNVPQTGPAILHAGEMVLPVPLANVLRDGGSGSSDNGAMLAELRRLADKLDRIERAQIQGSQLVASTVAKTGAESDRNNDQSRARNAQAQRRGVTA